MAAKKPTFYLDEDAPGAKYITYIDHGGSLFPEEEHNDYNDERNDIARPVEVNMPTPKIEEPGILDSISEGWDKLKHSGLAYNYFISPAERLAEAQRLQDVTGIDIQTLQQNGKVREKAYEIADRVDKLKKVSDFLNPDGSLDWDKVYVTMPYLRDIRENKGTSYALEVLNNASDLKTIADAYDSELGVFAGSVIEGLSSGLLSARRGLGVAAQSIGRFIQNERLSTSTDRWLRSAAEEEKRIRKYSQASLGGTLGTIAGSVAEQLPLLTAGAVGMGAGAAVVDRLGLLGLQAFATELGVSAAAMTPQIAGEHIAEHMESTTASGEYTWTPRQAIALGFAQGYAESLIEAADIQSLKRIWGGAGLTRRVANVLAGRQAEIMSEQAAREGLKNAFSYVLGDALKSAGKTMAVELREEFLQELTNDVLENAAQYTWRGGMDDAKSVQTILSDSVRAAVEAVPAVVGFGIMGFHANALANHTRLGNAAIDRLAESEGRFAMRVTHDNASRNNIRNTVANILNDSEGLTALDTRSPDVLRNILDTENEKADMLETDVDVRSLLNQEGGAELVQKIAQTANISAEEVQAATAEDATGFIRLKTSDLEILTAKLKESERALLDAHNAGVSKDGKRTTTDANLRKEISERSKLFAEVEQALRAERSASESEMISSYVEHTFNGEDERSVRVRGLAQDILQTNFNDPMSELRRRQAEIEKALNDYIGTTLTDLKRGMNQGTSVVNVDESGRGQRVSENAPWYQEWYKEHGKPPTKLQLQDIAIEDFINAIEQAKGEGLISAEEQAGADTQIQAVRALQQARDDLIDIEENFRGLIPSEMSVLLPMTAEARELYQEYLAAIDASDAPQAVKKSAKYSALLLARMADSLAEKYRQAGNREATVKDVSPSLSFGGETATRSNYTLSQFVGLEAAETLKDRKRGADPTLYNNYKKAKRLKSQGKTADEIYKETGWIEGKDEKWRYYIPDELDQINEDMLTTPGTYQMGKLYKNKQLWRLMPGLKLREVEIRPPKSDDEKNSFGAAYKDALWINLDAVKENVLEAKLTLVHELQHAIQLREKFAVGGDDLSALVMLATEINNLDKKFGKLKGWKEFTEIQAKLKSRSLIEKLDGQLQLDALQKKLGSGDFAKLNEAKRQIESKEHLYNRAVAGAVSLIDLYRMLAGEQEARETERLAQARYEGKDEGTPRPHGEDAIVFLEKDFKQMPPANGITINGVRYTSEQEVRNKGGALENTIWEALQDNDNNIQEAIQYLEEEIAFADESAKDGGLGWANTETEKAFKDALNLLKSGKVSVSQAQRRIPDVTRMLNQAASRNVKGNYDPMSRIISIFENGDQSTLIHEGAHNYLEVLEEIAAMFPDSGASKELARIMAWAEWNTEALKKYEGTAVYDEFLARDKRIRDYEAAGNAVDATREKWIWAQETFARGFEQYLKNGKAPVSSLKDVFRTFKKWLVNIYQTLVGGKTQNLDVGIKITPEIEGFFARMIASDIEIEMAEAEKHAKIITDIDPSLLDGQNADMLARWKEEAKEEAKEKLLAQLLKEYTKESIDLHMEAYEKSLRESLSKERVFQTEAMLLELDVPADEVITSMGYSSMDEYQQSLRNSNGGYEQTVEKNLKEERERITKNLPDAEIIREMAVDALSSTEYSDRLAALEAKALERRVNKYEKLPEQIVSAFKKLNKAIDDNDATAIKGAFYALKYASRWQGALRDEIDSLQKSVESLTKELETAQSAAAAGAVAQEQLDAAAQAEREDREKLKSELKERLDKTLDEEKLKFEAKQAENEKRHNERVRQMQDKFAEDTQKILKADDDVRNKLDQRQKEFEDATQKANASYEKQVRRTQEAYNNKVAGLNKQYESEVKRLDNENTKKPADTRRREIALQDKARERISKIREQNEVARDNLIENQKERVEKLKQSIQELKDKLSNNKEWLAGVRDSAIASVKMHREIARERLESMAVRDIMKLRHWQAEAQKADRQAAKSLAKAVRQNSEEDYEKAREAKVRQQHYEAMLHEAVAMTKKIRRMERNLKNRAKQAATSRDMDASFKYYLGQILYLNKVTNRKPDTPATLKNTQEMFDELMVRDPQGNIIVGDDMSEIYKEVADGLAGILQGTGATPKEPSPYNKLSYQNFTNLNILSNVLWKLGWNRNRLISFDGKTVDDVIKELREEFTANVVNATGESPIGSVVSQLARVEHLMKTIGGEDGKFHRYIYGTLRTALNNYHRMDEIETRVCDDMMNSHYTKEEQKALFADRVIVHVDENGKVEEFDASTKGKNRKNRLTRHEYTREEVIAMALNWGNDGNRERLLAGEKLTRAQMETIFETCLDERDWNFVSDIWSFLEHYGDEVNLVMEKQFGTPLHRIAPSDFQIRTKDGQDLTLSGGYYHIKYDAERSAGAAENDVMNANQAVGGAQVLGTQMGSTKQRAQKNPRLGALQLNLGVFMSHCHEQMNIINMKIPVTDVYKIICHPEFADMITSTYGIEAYQNIKRWCEAVWQTPRSQKTTFEKWIGHIRSSMTSAIMGFNFRIATLNYANLAVMADVMGAPNMARAMAEYITHPREQYKFAYEHSIAIRRRFEGQNRDFALQARRKWRGEETLRDRWEKIASKPMEWTDAFTCIPTFTFTYKQAYNDSIEKGMSEQDAIKEAEWQADKAVRRLLGSYDSVDKSTVERSNSEAVKLLTSFYSFFNFMGNEMWSKLYEGRYRGDTVTVTDPTTGAQKQVAAKRKFAKRYAAFARTFFYRIAVMSAMETALLMMISQATGDDDDKDLDKKFLKNYAANAGQTILAGNPIGSMLMQLSSPMWDGYAARSYRLGMLGSATERVERAAKDIHQLWTGKGKADGISTARDFARMFNAVTAFPDTWSDAMFSSLRFFTDADYKLATDYREAFFRLMYKGNIMPKKDWEKLKKKRAREAQKK